MKVRPLTTGQQDFKTLACGDTFRFFDHTSIWMKAEGDRAVNLESGGLTTVTSKCPPVLKTLGTFVESV